MRKQILTFIACSILCVEIGLGQGHSTSQTASKAKQELVKSKKARYGTASWYGSYFHGRKTANGETYNMWGKNTVATRDRTIPFGTRIRVTNLETGKSIIVRVNDRMAKTGKHSIDLSVGAFIRLAPRKQGVMKVKYEILRSKRESDEPKLRWDPNSARHPFFFDLTTKHDYTRIRK